MLMFLLIVYLNWPPPPPTFAPHCSWRVILIMKSFMEQKQLSDFRFSQDFLLFSLQTECPVLETAGRAKPAVWRWNLTARFQARSTSSFSNICIRRGQFSSALQPCFHCYHILVFVNVPLKDYIILSAPFLPQHISQCSAFSAQRQLVNSPVYNTATSWSTTPRPSVEPTHLAGPRWVCHDVWHHASTPPDQFAVLRHPSNDSVSSSHGRAFSPKSVWWQENRSQCFVFIFNPLWADWRLVARAAVCVVCAVLPSSGRKVERCFCLWPLTPLYNSKNSESLGRDLHVFCSDTVLKIIWVFWRSHELQ